MKKIYAQSIVVMNEIIISTIMKEYMIVEIIMKFKELMINVLQIL